MSVRELEYLPVYADVQDNVINQGSTYFTPISEYYSRIAKTCAKLAVIDKSYNSDTAAYLAGKYATSPSTYTITQVLTGCTLDNNEPTVSSDSVCMCKITPNTGLTIQSVSVTMGGNDVTANVYGNYNGYYAIRIGNVTGNIVITVTAS